MKESLEFYNQFDNKLIKDYANANKRLKSAIENLAKFIPFKNDIEILDIGCGIGWSTFEFSRFFPKAIVQGIDLSPILIKKAKTLFNNHNLSYDVFDITKDIPKNTFDVIVMIDVYEHIPIHHRNDFHLSLLNLLKEDGRIIMACPSVFHQNYLKENNPEGLQPIDEDIDQNVIQGLGRDIEGEIIYFEYQKIWRAYDYLYAVLQKGVYYNCKIDIKTSTTFQIENQNQRLKRLKDNLNIEFNIINKQSLINRILKKVKKKIS